MTENELQTFLKEGDFNAIDSAIGDFLCRIAESGLPELHALGSLLSRALREGSSCLEKKTLRDTMPDFELEKFLELPEIRKIVSAPSMETLKALIVTAERIYFQRYWRYERIVEKEISSRCRANDLPLPGQGEIAHIHEYFHFPQGDKAAIDHQQLAVFMALRSDFLFITGGPGTGKTTSIAALLAMELRRNPDLKIELCAPTGKAQQRMKEALESELPHLRTSPEIVEKMHAIPCRTLHSFYYSIPRKETAPAELLVIDECSMVPLSLLGKVLPRLSPDCRLVMLGDKDQLYSVETGAILNDAYAASEPNTFPAEAAEQFRQCCGWSVPVGKSGKALAGHTVELTVNHRFASAPTLSRFAAAIKTAPAIFPADISAEMLHKQTSDFRINGILPKDLSTVLDQQIHRPLQCGCCYADLIRLARSSGEENLQKAFQILREFQILCAVRQGPFGTENVNAIIRKLLHLKDDFAMGIPVMITANDHKRDLWNGDIGIIWPSAGNPKSPVVRFERNAEEFPPGTLNQYETLFAMTVHKSQGSGFSRVLFLLPEAESKLCTRELFYTAITRAAKEIEIWGSSEALQSALNRQTRRCSGLWKPENASR